MSVKSKHIPKKNFVFPVFTSFFQSFEIILFALFGFVVVITVDNQSALVVSTLGLFETLSAIIVLMLFGAKRTGRILRKLRSKKGFFLVVGTICGTALGNLFYFMAICFAGPSYGVALTALYPVFSLVLMKIFLKEKEPWKVWLGIFLSVTGGVLFVLVPSFVDYQNNNLDIKKITGMVSGLCAALFWSLESLFFKKSLVIKKERSFSTKETGAVMSIVACLFTWVLIMPVSCFFVGNTYKWFTELLFNWKTFLICLFLALNLICLRWFYIVSIKKIGPKLTAIFESNNFLFVITVSYFLSFLPSGLNGEPVFEQMTWQSAVFLLPISVGVWLSLYYQKGKQKTLDIH